MAKLTTSDLATPLVGNSHTTINNNFTAVETAMEKTLSRDGTSPNSMEANLDMNSNRIVNLPAATTNTEPVRKAEFDAALSYEAAFAGMTPINVLNYYVPGVHADHTTAINAAIAASVASLTYDADRVVDRAAQQRPVYFPPGVYTYSGAGVTIATDSYVLMYTDTPQAARIEITSNVNLITHSAYVFGTYIKNFHFVGGKGVTKYTKTTENVTSYHVFEDNVFDNYTVCAISNESSDMPYWHIARNYFYGTEAGGSIGIAIGGYLDSTRILYNSFCNNKYHLKIGWNWSGTVDIHYNDFIQFVANIRTADIWMVPSTISAAVNSGFGSSIRHNKFGNENQHVNDSRILIAAEGTGTDRANKIHSTTFYTTGQYISGLVFDNNRISSIANGVAPFIKCYIEHFSYFKYGFHNITDGGTHSYLIQYMGALGEGDAYLTRNSTFEIGPSQYMARVFTNGISNYGVGIVRDYSGIYATDNMTVGEYLYDDGGFANVANGRYADITVYGGASKSAVVDGYGGTETAEVTFTSASTSNGVYVACSTPVADVLHWLEVDIAAASSTSVFTLGIDVSNSTTGAVALRRTNLVLFPNARKVRIPFFFPDSTDPADWTASVYATDFAGGTRTKAKVAQLRVYQSRAPQNTNHLQTLGDGTWNTPHLVLGTHHIWVDSTGDLRINGSAPTSDTDGTIVGTQS